jgi:hypothetical protein
MKTIFITIALMFTLSASAEGLTAKSVKDLLQKIEASAFVYKETGKIFGYISTQSCLFSTDTMVIFRNYCFPVKNYPAKGYTIISPEHGVINIYQEDYGNGHITHQVSIREFPEILKNHLPESLTKATLADLSVMIEEMYNQYNPACWSTNYSPYTLGADFNCTISRSEVTGFDAWAVETQQLTNDESQWQAIHTLLQKKLVKPESIQLQNQR